MMIRLTWISLFLLVFQFASGKPVKILIEAESFKSRGGWVIDQQSMDVMGSPYILAHGFGTPVEDAQTTVKIPKKGKYQVWVRTYDWVARWNAKGAPGKFNLLINGKQQNLTFGTEGADWHWQKGDITELDKGEAILILKDLSGFDGRCDAILLTTDHLFIPPNEGKAMADFRKKALKLPNKPIDGGSYDLVVVGGGMAGICSAISAAREGITVALIQNRPVLGGNNSSEVRVGLSGNIHQKPYENLGNLVDQIGPVGHWPLEDAKRNPEAERSKRIFEVIKKHPEKKEHNAGPASNYEDEKKLNAVLAEKNISLFLNTHVFSATTKAGKITSVTGKNIVTSEEIKFSGKLFVDCTGDGTLGCLAGADFRIGREGKAQTGEPRAPEKPDTLVMGTSVQWNTTDNGSPSAFPSCPWAVQFTENTCHYLTKGDWDWETGAYRNHITEIEWIRDHALRVVYGNWDYIKNKGAKKEEFTNRKLSWVAYIGGKRESRRLMGDLILKEQDFDNHVEYPDATFTTTWGIDLHYPVETKGLNVEPYRSRADIKHHEPYAVPYRCLYSRNVDNLFMAGRNISVTHIALGSVRVMRTTGMMGEVVGMAAAICNVNNISPRVLYEENFEELKKRMERGVLGTK
jgi:hypothetical protein